MSIVYTGGTFDLFHAGHVNFLRQCYRLSRMLTPLNERSVFAELGATTEVVVSLNTDRFIKQFKGKPPIYNYDERVQLLLACKYVDRVIANEGGTDSKPAISKVEPDMVVIGSDWATKDYYKQMNFTQQWLDYNNILLIYVPYTPGVSTTELKKRIEDY